MQSKKIKFIKLNKTKLALKIFFLIQSKKTMPILDKCSLLFTIPNKLNEWFLNNVIMMNGILKSKYLKICSLSHTQTH